MEKAALTQTRTKKRIDTLQALRGFACLLVVFSHSPYRNVFSTSWGGFGVSIFIILSGFLTTLGYTADTVRTDMKIVPHTLKRIKSVYPVHFVMLLVLGALAIYGVIRGGEGPSWIEIVLTLTMTKAFVPIKDYYYGFMSPTWYLTLVWFFALLTPLLLKLIKKIKRHIPIVAALVILFRIVWRTVWHGHDNSLWITYVNPFFRVTDYFLGMLLGVEIEPICKRLKKIGGGGGVLFASVLLLSAIYIFAQSYFTLPWYHTFARTPLTVGLITCCYMASSNNSLINRSTLKNPVLVFLGNISLEIYLMHMFAYTLAAIVCSKLHIDNGFVEMSLMLVAVIFGAVAYRFIFKWISAKLKKEKT